MIRIKIKPFKQVYGRYIRLFAVCIFLLGLMAVPAPPLPSQSCQGSFHFGGHGTTLNLHHFARTSGSRIGCAYSGSI